MASSSAVKAGEGFIELFLKSGKLHAGLTAAGKKLASWSAGLGGAGAAIAGASGAVMAPLLMAIKDTANMGDNLRDMSIKTGMSTNALSELGFAAEQSGGSLDGIVGSVAKMQKFLGSANASKELRSIGVSLDELSGMSPDRQLETIGDAISRIEDPTKRTTAWLKIFGRSGVALAPMFADGAAGVRAMRQEMVALGGSFDSSDAAAADEFNDSFNKLSKVFQVVKTSIGNALIPAITDVFEVVLDVVKPIGLWVKENKELFVTIFKVAAAGMAIGGILTALGTAGLVLSGVILGLKTILIGVAAVITFLGTPLGVAIASVAALSAAFVYATGLSGTLISAFKGITAALLGAKWGLAGAIAMKTLEIVWLNGLSVMSSAFSRFGAFVTEKWFGIIDRIKSEWLGLRSLVDPTFNYAAEKTKLLQEGEKRRAEAAKNTTDIYSERIKKAQGELNTLIAEALKKREKEIGETASDSHKRKLVKDPPKDLGVVGTYSGFAARILGARTAPTVQERIAAASEETNEILKEYLEEQKRISEGFGE